MDKIKLSGLAALTVAFGLGACSHTTVETPAPSASTGATVTTTTTASKDTTAAGYQASGNAAATTSTSVTTPSTSVTATTTVPSTSTSATTTTTVPSTSATVATGMSANGAQTLVFTPVNNSGFTGNVVLTDMGDHTRVALTLNSPANTDASADHNAAIHTGTCAAPGAKVQGLDDVEGNGKASNTEVNMRLAQLTDGQHIIVANENPGDRAIVCVAIPSR